ncbi:MAG: hypothetical protein KC620_07890, partial [Myxococcales bacterium]|nr:hypothetical protein [Myxococcales bacterium]
MKAGCVGLVVLLALAGCRRDEDEAPDATLDAAVPDAGSIEVAGCEVVIEGAAPIVTLLPLSGPLGDIGEGIRRGAEVAVARIDAA